MAGMRVGSMMVHAAAVMAVVGFVPSEAQQDGVSVTFLANEGVLLQSATKKVLIDALFLKYDTDFALPADSTQTALQGARAPFNTVDLILVTHHHGDHFHPAPVAAHMRANPGATLLASAQVIDSLRGRVSGTELAGPRFLARTTPPGQRRREVVNGITVEVLGLAHAPGVEHLGYIVDIGGRRVLHVGDTNGTEADFEPFRLDTARIDVALLPHWMLQSADGLRAIERWIRPRQVVAFHVEPSGAARIPGVVQAAMPGAITFVRSLETRRW